MLVNRSTWLAASSCMLLLSGCPDRARSGADAETETDEGSGGSGSGTSAGTGGSMGSETESGSSGDVPVDCEEIEPGGIEPEETVWPEGCTETLDQCELDEDHDGIPLACDNDRRVHNPAQRDADADGFGDVGDLCPVVAALDNELDSDRDGVGNDCDTCRASLGQIDTVLEAAGVPSRLRVRNVPIQQDSDLDGIGDACDNCPAVPNCAAFGPREPAQVGDEVPFDDPGQCQADADADGIGDACAGATAGAAAGPMGFGPDDDLDQDGLTNATDVCPRLAVDARACADDDDCPDATACAAGVCNHADHDGDGVGTECDTCPTLANALQIAEGGAAEDDPDGDFIGAACETHAFCAERSRPRPIGFFDVAANGYCCVTTWPGDDALVDPDGRPLRVECTPEQEDAGTCRAVPSEVLARPGVGVLPPGCEEALASACKLEASPVALDDVGGDLVAWWSHACQLPPRDQDFDGIGDECDLCVQGFDPGNQSYVDANGMRWPNDGAYCNGDYSADQLDPENGCVPG
jgi:hypothetical protein